MTHARIATRIVIAIVISVAAWTSAFAQPATDNPRRLKSQNTAAEKPVQAVRPRLDEHPSLRRHRAVAHEREHHGHQQDRRHRDGDDPALRRQAAPAGCLRGGLGRLGFGLCQNACPMLM